jgi:hypothetical protein
MSSQVPKLRSAIGVLEPQLTILCFSVFAETKKSSALVPESGVKLFKIVHKMQEG